MLVNFADRQTAAAFSTDMGHPDVSRWFASRLTWGGNKEDEDYAILISLLPGTPYTREYEWVIFTYPLKPNPLGGYYALDWDDLSGYLDPSPFRGGLINHGTEDAPSWSSHS